MNLIELLQEYDVDFRQGGESPHVSQGWLGVVCPFCGEGTGKFGMGLNPDSLSASCWKCGRHWILDVLRELTGEKANVLRDQLDGLSRMPVSAGARRGRYTVPDAVGPLGKVHRNYLRSRDYDPEELVRLWDLGGIGLHPRLAWRLFLPVRELGGNFASWTTRSVVRGNHDGMVERRYINASPEEEAVPIKSLLYGAHHARHAVVVVEGPTDAWRIGPGAVATFGLTVTAAQKAALAKYPLRAICFDNEPEAQRRAAALCEELKALPGKTTRVELDAPDPGEASPREVELLRRSFLE